MRVLKNFAYNFMYQLLIIIVPLITMPFVSRILGVEGVGLYSYTHAIANYFVLFSMLGLNNYGNREIAKVRDDKAELSKTFWNIYIMQIVTAAISTLLYIFFINQLNPEFSYLARIQIIFVVSTLFNVNWLFFGLEKFRTTVLRSSLIKVGSVILIFLLIKRPEDIDLYTYILSFSFLISELILWFRLKTVVNFIKPEFVEVIKHIKPNLVLFIPVISISLYKIMGKVMIGMFSDITQLGYYENAFKINQVQISLATALGTVMLPRMSNLVKKKKDSKVKMVIRDSMQFVMFLSVGLCFGIIAIAFDFVPLFLGNDFLPSANILIILAPTGILVSWANVIRTQYLIPHHEDNIYIKSVILGALVNITLGYILISTRGAIGAAFAAILSEGAVSLYQTFKVRKVLNITTYIKDSWVFVVFGSLMYLFISIFSNILNDSSGRIVLQVISGGSIYLLLTYLYFRFISKDRLVHFMSFFKKNKSM